MKASTLALLLLVVVSCTNFPVVEENTCGNFVLEPGEDCDSSSAIEDGTCGAPATALACFRLCQNEGAGPACPTGWGCGADGRCRQPSGEFAVADNGVHAFDVEDFALGDVDGDGNLDLIGNRGDELTVLFGDELGAFSSELRVPIQSPLGPVVFGQFDSDERFDVVVPTADGILVLLGTEERSLEAKTFTSASLGNDTQRLAAIQVRPEAVTDILVINESKGEMLFRGSSLDPVPLFGGANSALEGPVSVADLIGDATPEFALALQGASEIQVYRITGSSPDQLTPVLLQTLSLPAGSTIDRGIQFFDLDQDNDPDLLISFLNAQGEPRLAVASNTQVAASLFAPPSQLQVGGSDENRRPLLLAKLTNDNVPEFILPDGIYVASASSGNLISLTLRAHAGNRLWDSALVADFNGDGAPDVAAASSDVAEVQIFLGTGTGLFNKFVVQTKRPPKGGPDAMIVGDFDGDFIDDLAFAGAATDGPDTLEVVYGAASGGFAGSVSMGELGSMEVLLPVFTADAFGVLDGTTDIAVLSSKVEGKVMAELRGTSSRRMVSPYVLRFDGEVQIPTALAIGEFSSPADAVVDILAIATAPVEEGVGLGGGGPEVAGRDPSVWLIPGESGDGSLGASVTPSALSGNGLFNEGCANWTAGSIREGRDVLIGIDGAAGCYLSEEAQMQDGESASLSLLVAQPADSGPEAFTIDSTELNSPLRNPTEIRLVDFDLDGGKDLIAIFEGAPFADEQTSSSGTVLFWNVNGHFSEGMADTALGDYAEELLAVRTLRLDGDDNPDWAVLASDGIYTANFIAETKLFTVPIRKITTIGSRSLEAGDVNRDGVDDLVLLFGSEVKILLGVPKQPLGSLAGSQPIAPSAPSGEGY